MTVLNKDNIPRPIPPKEVLDVPELGGEIIVRGLLLSDRVRILTKAGSGGQPISEVLAASVIDAKEEPIFDVEEWEAFGASNFNVTLSLFQKAKELSGLDVETNQKK